MATDASHFEAADWNPQEDEEIAEELRAADEWLSPLMILPPPSSSDASVPGFSDSREREPSAETVYKALLSQQIPHSWRKGDRLPEPEERQAREWIIRMKVANCACNAPDATLTSRGLLIDDPSTQGWM